MPLQTYRDLHVWQKAMELVVACHSATKRFPASERLGLTQEIQQAAIAIPANIAAGHGLRGKGEYLHHLTIAKGSLARLETLFLIAHDLKFTSDDSAQEVAVIADDVGRMLYGLMQKLGARKLDASPLGQEV